MDSILTNAKRFDVHRCKFTGPVFIAAVLHARGMDTVEPAVGIDQLTRAEVVCLRRNGTTLFDVQHAIAGKPQRVLNESSLPPSDRAEKALRAFKGADMAVLLGLYGDYHTIPYQNGLKAWKSLVEDPSDSVI